MLVEDIYKAIALLKSSITPLLEMMMLDDGHAFVPFTIQSNINSYLVFVPNAGSVVVPRGALGRSYGGLEDPLPCPNTPENETAEGHFV